MLGSHILSIIILMFSVYFIYNKLKNKCYSHENKCFSYLVQSPRVSIFTQLAFKPESEKTIVLTHTKGYKVKDELFS